MAGLHFKTSGLHHIHPQIICSADGKCIINFILLVGKTKNSEFRKQMPCLRLKGLQVPALCLHKSLVMGLKFPPGKMWEVTHCNPVS